MIRYHAEDQMSNIKNDEVPPVPTADECFEVYKIIKALHEKLGRHGLNAQKCKAINAIHQSGTSMMQAVESLSFDEYMKKKAE